MDIFKIIFPLVSIGILIVFLLKIVNKKGKNKNNNREDNNYLAEGIGIGLIFGSTLGFIFDNMEIYIPIGMLMGLVIGEVIEK